MTLPIAGNPISLSQVQDELGGVNPVSISEYYGSAAVLPTVGEISMSDFFGVTAPVPGSTVSTNVQNLVVSDYISSGGTLTIDAGVYIWSDDTSQPAMLVDVANCTIVNNGYIIGRGGNGGSGSVDSTVRAGKAGGQDNPLFPFLMQGDGGILTGGEKANS